MYVLDNARIHHYNGVIALISELNFSILSLPSYSTFLNIIENCFSKCKNTIGKMMINTRMNFLVILMSFHCITSDVLAEFFKKMLRYLPRCRNNEIIYFNKVIFYIFIILYITFLLI
ncbi:hypothetical protein SLOPH_665 [Spraguea lophii 42_110]|uniref:Tc1-like transposase DDE domain-containing protein n=1 Tax=Spraguea lophii (strain 42_110) TaxID=1358809 RepID=S7XPE9_SPRLO|nr:hypothetical protein SLOPH_665 [Spraguea lophii 42_110]